MAAQLATSFDRLGFQVSRAWFDQCYEWCKEENPRANAHQLIEEIKRQWYLTDIREDGVQQKPQIQEAWLSARKIVIKSTLFVQVLSAIDVAKPAYVQLQEMLRIDNANTMVTSENQEFKAAWEPKGMFLRRFEDDFWRNLWHNLMKVYNSFKRLRTISSKNG